MSTGPVQLHYQPAAPAVDATRRYTLLGLLCAAAAIAYVQRSGIAVAAGSIQNDLALDKARFGEVMSAWSLGYALMQIPSGWLADRWGSRRALTLYAIAWSAATGLIAVSYDYYSILVLWALMGVAQAGIFPCSTKAISRWFVPERRASASGLLGAFMGIGGAVAPVLTGLLLTIVTWRWTFLLYAAPGVAWAMLFYRMARDDPQEELRSPGSRPVDAENERDLTAPVPDSRGSQYISLNDAPSAPARIEPASEVWRRLLTSASVWLLCAQQFLRAAAMIFFATWFPTYLREHRGVTLVQSGFLTTLAGVGLVLGALLGGFASDRVLTATGNRWLSRQGIAVAGMLSRAALIIWAHFIADPTSAVLIISAGAFCGAFGGVSGYTVAMDLGGPRVATLFSLMNMCGNIGAALFPLAIGWLVQHTGTWDPVLFIFAGIFVVDAVCWFLMNPKGPLFEER